MEACIAGGVHYLDITAEFNVYALAESLSNAAARAGVMLLPGVGGTSCPAIASPFARSRRSAIPGACRPAGGRRDVAAR
jgi:short subunit dehydrogenase-like uncharacterized protein